MATTYTAIPDASIDPDSPETVQLFTRIRDNPLAIAQADATAPTLPMGRMFYAEEQKAAGTDSASIPNTTPGARRDWVEVIDTLGNDGTGGGSVGGANNTQITLPAGTYYIRAWAICVSNEAVVHTHRILLYNTSDAAYNLVGSSMVLLGLDGASSVSTLFGKVTLAAQKVFELRHDSNDNDNTGGTASNFGASVEVYAGFEAWQLIDAT